MLFHSLVDKCFKFQGIVFFAQSGTLLVHLVDIFIPSLCFFFQFFDSPQQSLGDGQSGNGFPQRFNVYTINPKIIWKSWGKNIKYCEFPANIIISKAEQEADTAKINEHFKKVMNIKQEESES